MDAMQKVVINRDAAATFRPRARGGSNLFVREAQCVELWLITLFNLISGLAPRLPTRDHDGPSLRRSAFTSAHQY